MPGKNSIYTIWVLLMLSSASAQLLDMKQAYRDIEKAAERHYRSPDLLVAITRVHQQMDSHKRQLDKHQGKAKRSKKRHRYGFLFSKFYRHCEGLNLDKKALLESEIREQERQFSQEIREFQRLQQVILSLDREIFDLRNEIELLREAIDIQESEHTFEKRRRLDFLLDELAHKESELRRAQAAQNELRTVLRGLDRKIEELSRIEESLAVLQQWWRTERESLAKKRFLVAEYVLNEQLFLHYIEETGKRVVRVYYY